MLSTKEMLDYIQPSDPVCERGGFSIDEAREIGGRLGVSWDVFDVNQFQMGLNTELEHGVRDPATDVTHDDPLMTGKIALAHLHEFPDYYSHLARMERMLERQATPHASKLGRE